MPKSTAPSNGLARALSKLGYCSRREAEVLILAGRVQVNSVVCRRIDQTVDSARSIISVDGIPVRRVAFVYVMLNKPRGLVTTTADERGRETVFQCLEGSGLPRLVPVGRLDQASEGMLLLTNDTQWANGITEPGHGCLKTYHVHIDRQPTPEFLRQLETGIEVDGEFLRVVRATTVRVGERHSWLELVLDEGRNRHLRRLLGAFGTEVLQLVRIEIGKLRLGSLQKGQWRHLTPEEVQSLRKPTRAGN